MHISDYQNTQNTILTKCAKMTEESHRRHGINGNADGGVAPTKEEYPRNSYNQGGRLKFFKDGKFILELERARAGERVSWVSVPRKTFWPPQGTATSTPSYRQESSTSLSVSDDNSSVQSSPWQRDHSWKQTVPRHNLSKEMSFCFIQNKRVRFPKSKKSRRPFSATPEPDRKVRERTSAITTTTSVKRVSLDAIIQSLKDKTASASPPRTDVVSPRKRFLREMEKDKAHVDDACQKRSKCKNQSPSSAAKTSSPAPVVNGITEEVRPSKNCSYSITSLLSEDRGSRRSPEDVMPPASHVTSHPQFRAAAPEEGWYSESVDRLRYMELSVDKRAPLPTYPPYPHYMPHYVYPYSLPTYYSTGVYGRGGYLVPPMHPTPPLPMTVRHEAPSCSWTAEPSRESSENRDDNITDMPLNLSKHGG